jgi:hypothetical protein
MKSLADAIEHHHRVVERVADHRQHRRHHRQVERGAGQREDAKHQYRVVQHRQDRTQRQPPGMEAQRNVAEDQQQRRGERLRGATLQFAADLRTDHLDLLDLRAGIQRLQDLLDPAAHLLGALPGRRQPDGDVARGAEDRDLRIGVAGAISAADHRIAVGRGGKAACTVTPPVKSTPRFSPRVASDATEIKIRTIDRPYHSLRVDMNGKLVAR